MQYRIDRNRNVIYQDTSPEVVATLAKTLSKSPEPLAIDSLVSEVAASRPLGNGSRISVEHALESIYQAVPIGQDTYGWLSHLLDGTTFCHPLSASEIQSGHMVLDELEHAAFFPQFFQDQVTHGRAVEITMFGGETVRVEPVLYRKMWTLKLGEKYAQWLFDLGVESRDDILIRVLDASEGQYEIRASMRELRDERALEKRNIRLAMLAEELVAEDSRTRELMPTWDLIARLIGRGFFNHMPPTDDLHYVLGEYSMLRFVDGIGYQLDVEAAARIFGQEDAMAARHSVQQDSKTPRQYRDLSDSGRGSEGSDPEDDRESYPSRSREEDDAEMDDEICPAYQQYLDSYAQESGQQTRLRHDEFHLLEAELDLLIQLEAEFGGLLPEQEARKEALAARLYIDPDSLANMGWDAPNGPNLEDPPFWIN